MCEDGWPLRAAEGAVDDVIAVELLPLVHGLTAAPAEVAVAVEGHEPFLVRDMTRAEAALGCRSLPAGHGVTRRLRSGGRAAASTWSWSVRPAVAARGVRPDLVERMVMLVSVADDDGVAVLAVAPGGHDCAGMPSAYDARAIAVLAPGNDYPVTDAGHASRHQWPGWRTVPVMRSVTGPGLLPALLPRITPPGCAERPALPVSQAVSGREVSGTLNHANSPRVTPGVRAHRTGV